MVAGRLPAPGESPKVRKDSFGGSFDLSDGNEQAEKQGWLRVAG
jgi:hypothetical protein